MHEGIHGGGEEWVEASVVDGHAGRCQQRRVENRARPSDDVPDGHRDLHGGRVGLTPAFQYASSVGLSEPPGLVGGKALAVRPGLRDRRERGGIRGELGARLQIRRVAEVAGEAGQKQGQRRADRDEYQDHGRSIRMVAFASSVTVFTSSPTMGIRPRGS
jgi:hypothetical protein